MDLAVLLNVVHGHLAEGRTEDDLKRWNRELEADPSRPASQNVDQIMRLMGGRVPPALAGLVGGGD